MQKYTHLLLATLCLWLLVIIISENNFLLLWIDANIQFIFLKNSLLHGLHYASLIAWTLATFLLIRYTELFFWKLYFPKTTGTPTPKILIDIFSIVVWIISLGIALNYFFDKDITALLTASSVLVGVLGFALRGMIADFFYGIAITLEQTYRVGDWIEISDKSGIKIGEVQQIAWRSTLIVTEENIHVTVPHSVIASSNFNNYSFPDPIWRSQFKIVLGHDISPQEAERIFISAIKQVKETASIAKEPSIRIVQFLPQGIEWSVRFWVKDYPMKSSVQAKIQYNILWSLTHCGIQLPNEKLDILTEKVCPKRSNWAQNLEIFIGLHEEVTENISQQAIKRFIAKGQVLFEQGSAGNSLFLVYQGLVDVLVKNKAGVNQKINQMCGGDVFGEMSLLTGDPRTATVIASVDSVLYEITQAMIEPYLHEYPALLEHIEKLLSERKLKTIHFLNETKEQKEVDIIRQNTLLEIRYKVRRFFNLNQ